MTPRPELRLVPYDPEDYSLGGVLVRENHELVDAVSEIHSAFSLYFQWPEYRMCRTYFKNLPKPVECVIDYDADEITPTELRVRLTQPIAPNNRLFGETVTLRFEVFGSCYEFSAAVLAVSENPEADGWDAIVAIPSALLVCKHRRSRRILLPEPTLVTWLDGPAHEAKEIELLEIGPTSMRVRAKAPITPSIGIIIIGGRDFPSQVLRTEGNETVLGLHFETGKTAGDFFDIYSQFAFPSLRPRASFGFEDLFKLYEQTNYTAKFNDDAGGALSKSELSSVWDGLVGASDVSADYISVDAQGMPTGASSVAMAFLDGRTQVWAFHQLCAKARPDLLDHSGQLYAWRAEYLVGRPEEIDIIGWFDSKSRWLERIYVKFALQKYGQGVVHAVRVHLETFEANASEKSTAQSFPMGKLTRWLETTSNSILAACAHRLLNVSSVLEAIVDIRPKPDWEMISHAGKSLSAAMGGTPLTLEITTVPGLPESDARGKAIESVDRYFRFPKSALLDFLASVEHSLAVTIRKKAKHGANSPAL